MANGFYVAPERVERDGVLVCFAGERMTMAEAERRGIAPAKAQQPSKPARRASRKAESR